MTARRLVDDLVLPGDPQVWGPAYHARIAQVGDDGTNCVVCGRRTGGKKRTRWVLVSHRGTLLPPAELPAPGEGGYDEGTHTMGCGPIGSECAKTVDARYLIPGDQVAGTG